MGFNCGIIGLPNVGKSTLFNAITSSKVKAGAFAFSTKDSNVGRVEVPDSRLDKLAEMVSSKKVIAAQMEFVDIAGLAEGASKGEGLGNRFLSHIRQVDAMAHVVRCFESEDVLHVKGDINPVRDIEIVETELLLADLESVEKKMAGLRKSVKSGNKKDVELHAKLEKIAEGIGEGIPASQTGGLEIVNDLQLLTTKPVMFIANIGDPSDEESETVNLLREAAKKRNAAFIAVCAGIEAEIAELDPEDRQQYREEMGLSESGLHRMIREGYSLLKLITFLTAGPKESHAWTIHAGSNAVEAAGKIHSDFIRGFIRAEVIPYNDYVECKGETGAKEAGKMRLEGKEYIVKDGDVIVFRVAP